MTLKDLKDQINELYAITDPEITPVKAGRMDSIRREIKVTLTILDGMIADQKKPWYKIFK